MFDNVLDLDGHLGRVGELAVGNANRNVVEGIRFVVEAVLQLDTAILEHVERVIFAHKVVLERIVLRILVRVGSHNGAADSANAVILDEHDCSIVESRRFVHVDDLDRNGVRVGHAMGVNHPDRNLENRSLFVVDLGSVLHGNHAVFAHVEIRRTNLRERDGFVRVLGVNGLDRIHDSTALRIFFHLHGIRDNLRRFVHVAQGNRDGSRIIEHGGAVNQLAVVIKHGLAALVEVVCHSHDNIEQRIARSSVLFVVHHRLRHDGTVNRVHHEEGRVTAQSGIYVHLEVVVQAVRIGRDKLTGLGINRSTNGLVLFHIELLLFNCRSFVHVDDADNDVPFVGLDQGTVSSLAAAGIDTVRNLHLDFVALHRFVVKHHLVLDSHHARSRIHSEQAARIRHDFVDERLGRIGAGSLDGTHNHVGRVVLFNSALLVAVEVDKVGQRIGRSIVRRRIRRRNHDNLGNRIKNRRVILVDNLDSDGRRIEKRRIVAVFGTQLKRVDRILFVVKGVTVNHPDNTRFFNLEDMGIATDGLHDIVPELFRFGFLVQGVRIAHLHLAHDFIVGKVFVGAVDLGVVRISGITDNNRLFVHVTDAHAEALDGSTAIRIHGNNIDTKVLVYFVVDRNVIFQLHFARSLIHFKDIDIHRLGIVLTDKRKGHLGRGFIVRCNDGTGQITGLVFEHLQQRITRDIISGRIPTNKFGRIVMRIPVLKFQGYGNRRIENRRIVVFDNGSGKVDDFNLHVLVFFYQAIPLNMNPCHCRRILRFRGPFRDNHKAGIDTTYRHLLEGIAQIRFLGTEAIT